MKAKHAAGIALAVYAVGAGAWIAWEHRAAPATLSVDSWAAFGACMTGPLTEGELPSDRVKATAAAHDTADWPRRCLPHAEAVLAALASAKPGEEPAWCLASNMRAVAGAIEKGELPGRGSLNRAYFCAAELAAATGTAPSASQAPAASAVPPAPSARAVFGPGPALGEGALDAFDPPFGTSLRFRSHDSTLLCRVAGGAARAACDYPPNALALFDHDDFSFVPSATDGTTHVLVEKSGAEGGGVYDLDRGERIIPAGPQALNGAYVDREGAVYAVGQREASDDDASRFVWRGGTLDVARLARVPVKRAGTRVLGGHVIWFEGRQLRIRPLTEVTGRGMELGGLGWLGDLHACGAGATTFGVFGGQQVVAARGDAVRVHELAEPMPPHGAMSCSDGELTYADIGEGAVEVWRCRFEGCGHERYERYEPPDAGGAFRAVAVVGDTIFLSSGRGAGVRLATGALADIPSLRPHTIFDAPQANVHGTTLIPRGDVAYLAVETAAGVQVFRVSRAGAVEPVLPR